MTLAGKIKNEKRNRKKKKEPDRIRSGAFFVVNVV